MNWLIRTQSVVTLASGMIFPYYLLFLKNIGNSYSKYGLAFAMFTISSALASQWLAPRLDHAGGRWLAVSSVGMMVVMLAYPWTTSYVVVLVLQFAMGVCNAMQRMSERLLIADYTKQGHRGPDIGSYHFWTSIASGFAVLLGGILIDWLTIDVLFYTSAILYGWAGWAVWRSIGRTSTSSLHHNSVVIDSELKNSRSILPSERGSAESPDTRA